MLFYIDIRGLVQGVGFRPFVYNLALKESLKGFVANSGDGVHIELECSYRDLFEFMESIQLSKPPLSKIEHFSITQKNEIKSFENFTIKESEKSSELSAMIPSDLAMCSDCQEELGDKSNRRYRYPFISCTNCGPRFSIIKNLPYDRGNTSMDKFEMCDKCKQEYENPQDRRYHAQPIGCFDCGATLTLFWDSSEVTASASQKAGAKATVPSFERGMVESNSKKSIDEIVTAIKDGKIVAIKGIGGYHLVCNAENDKSIKLLREQKNRPTKPFAVMVKDIEMAKSVANISPKEERVLSSNRRPIVLCRQKENRTISSLVAPNIRQIGLFLPYTPIHSLILQRLNSPIVASSANISGDPLCRTHDEIMKLSHIWDYCLDHDREIVNSCDDSIAFVENGKTFMLRVARGYSPIYLKLPKPTDKKILCLGANQKSTVAIVIKDRVIISPYIGDLDTIESINYFKSHIDRLKRIYNFKPDIMICDKHPSYSSTKYAKELVSQNPNIKLIQIQHHYAHIQATMGMNGINQKVLGVSFDGTGYGDDDHLWGGEFLICDRSRYERVGQFKYFRLLGGDMAIKEPRRVALSFLFEIYGERAIELDNHTVNSFSSRELKTLYIAWKKGLNSPLSSSCGRLFDSVASILGLMQISSYEGESGLLMESLYDDNITNFYQFSLEDGEIDFSKIFTQIEIEKEIEIAVSKFFNTLIEIIYMMNKRYNLPVVISGGVFQNRVLLRLIMNRIPSVIVPLDFVSNDGAISFGQAVAAID